LRVREWILSWFMSHMVTQKKVEFEFRQDNVPIFNVQYVSYKRLFPVNEGEKKRVYFKD